MVVRSGGVFDPWRLARPFRGFTLTPEQQARRDQDAEAARVLVTGWANAMTCACWPDCNETVTAPIRQGRTRAVPAGRVGTVLCSSCGQALPFGMAHSCRSAA